MKTFIHALTNLQDARYCAAMGIDYAGFSLERGSDRKLPVTLVWNMVQWLTGPEIVLHLNADSLEELEEARKSIPVAAITLPLADVEAGLGVADPSEMILLCGAEQAAEAAALLARYPGLRVEIMVEALAEVPEELPADRTIVHLTARDGWLGISHGHKPGWYGMALGSEVLNAQGELDYEWLDEIMPLL